MPDSIIWFICESLMIFFLVNENYVVSMSTTRITINVKNDILELLEAEVKEQDKARAHMAGYIIEMYFTADEPDEESYHNEYESKIISLESEVRELKADKTWYQGELSKLNSGLLNGLPAPRKPFKLFWWKIKSSNLFWF